MSDWQPGQPVVTADDDRAWRDWCRARKRDAQRHRRATCRRIDYYPGPDAAVVIDERTHRFAGSDYSTVIDALVIAGAESFQKTMMASADATTGTTEIGGRIARVRPRNRLWQRPYRTED
jgi:hypothetical protein